MYGDFVKQMNNAVTASERSTVIQEMCRLFGFKSAKAYKVLKAQGWSSGRKRRTDCGSTSVSEKNLNAVASLLQNSVRKNGKKTMSVEIARSILIQNGFDMPVSNGRLRELLKEKTLSTESTAKASPSVRMRTEYPNQVHFADPSLALLYFAPGGKQHVLRDDEVYKNKPFLEGREQLKCWRYVLTDHYSSSICVRYYAIKGENAATMWDFLLYAWSKKKDPLYNFHGLPELLIWDCGSANVSKPVTNALKALRVETKPHMPGNPRAKGQVEKANDIVETQFECLLKLEPVNSIEALNDAAERWCAAFNSNALAERDTRLTRAGKKIGSRAELWNRIKITQLRELPDASVCRMIFTTGIQVRTIGGDLTISIVHPNVKVSMRYSLAGLPGVMIGMTVNVQPVLVDADATVQVSYKNGEGNIVSFEVKPLNYNEMGFDENAPVFGQGYVSQPDTLREKNVKHLAELAATSDGSADGVPFVGITNGQGFKTHSLIHASDPFAQQTTGRKIEVAAGTVEIHEIRISAVEAAKRFRARTGVVPEGFISRMKKEYPEGVPSNLIDDLAAEYDGSSAAEKLA